MIIRTSTFFRMTKQSAGSFPVEAALRMPSCFRPHDKSHQEREVHDWVLMLFLALRNSERGVK